MFKYTPRAEIIARFKKLKSSPYPAWWNYLDQVVQQFSYGDCHSRYRIRTAFYRDYQRMSAFYSNKKLTHVPCGGVLIPREAFDEEKV